MTIVWMIFGNSGSGKSWLARVLSERFNAPIICADALRQKLTGDEFNQHANLKVWQEVYKKLHAILAAGTRPIIILDATFANQSDRQSMIAFCQNLSAEVWGIFMKTPYELCIARQSLRDRQVPAYAIHRMETALRNSNLPSGFDRFFVHLPDGTVTSH